MDIESRLIFLLFFPNLAITVFKQKYPKAEDIYVIQDLFKGK